MAQQTARRESVFKTLSRTFNSFANLETLSQHQQYVRRTGDLVVDSRNSDPAERSALMRLLYRNWRPTQLGRWVNRLSAWWSGLGLPPRFQAILEVQGRTSGRTRSNPVVIVTVGGNRYLVSMLGSESDWVKNVKAAHGDAIIRQGFRQRVHLAPIPPEQRSPILREYVRIAPSGRQHFPLSVGAPVSEFAAIAAHYPVYRIDPS